MDSNFLTEFLTHKEAALPNGETLCYREVGSGPQVLILVHGILSSSITYKKVAPLFAADMRVIAVDVRGFGYSSYNKSIITHQELADDIKLLLDELKISKCSILGWSTGGMITFHFAAKYSEVTEKLILISSVGPQGKPFYKWQEDGQQTKELIMKPEDMKYNLQTRLTAEAVASRDSTLMRKMFDLVFYRTLKVDESFLEFRVDMAMKQRNVYEVNIANLLVNVTDEDNGISKGDGSIKKLKCPTLVLHGNFDKSIAVADAKKWATLLGDLVITHIFSDGTHNLFDGHLNEVVELVSNFVLSGR